ncbi:FadR/GntR family transcriptional regulator [Sphingobium boeckii]|uniref:GntR family transcriptional repressor for pyruvate dehydrogenase complex n=1 Tax=Sphingobium boeckii TaxID=1082345 RepID=A0A7W9AHR6_9SPHN|nr:FadR/GntR family transcriptional regulator [Sphingobium boeckii]MBB5685928.1 GntR family transcriptional repressor for pyruvate dehydrogenase complex [Sphingobium boeckii]
MEVGVRSQNARTAQPDSHSRLYKQLARHLFDDIVSGKYGVGDRLPAERELAAEHNVSRPTVREAIIALEVQGLIEVRVGSGAYVCEKPGYADAPGFNVTAFELIEARRLIEAEAAALAATQITDEELDQLDALVKQIAAENSAEGGTEEADRAFHLLIARATRNAAIVDVIEHLWRMRASSPDIALLLAKARAAQVKPVVHEHEIIAAALRRRNPDEARAAMRVHLAAVLDHLLFATEEAAVEQVRNAARDKRERFAALRAG